MYVVLMIEPALKGETLTVEEQINEVFGPFTEQEADKWTAEARRLLPTRRWLIMQFSEPLFNTKEKGQSIETNLESLRERIGRLDTGQLMPSQDAAEAYAICDTIQQSLKRKRI